MSITDVAGMYFRPRSVEKSLHRLPRQARSSEVVLSERFKFRDLRRKAATDKAIATDEKEAEQLLAHSDVKTTRKHYIAPRGVKPTRVRPVI